MATGNEKLKHLLSSDAPMDELAESASQDVKRQLSTNNVPLGFCVECEDQPATVACQDCDKEIFCEVCWHALHRRGKRAKHNVEKLGEATPEARLSHHQHSHLNSASASQDVDVVMKEPAPQTDSMGIENSSSDDEEEEDTRLPAPKFTSITPTALREIGLAGDPISFRERARYIPLRLSLKERRTLRLLEAALNVSEYTDHVDIISGTSKAKRVHVQLFDMCAILSGLLVASDYKAGQLLVEERNFKQNAQFFQEVFEIGRRHKILNPEKMRTEYGKLIHLLMDSVSYDVQPLLEFSCVKELQTVRSFLELHGGLAMLDDPDMMDATKEVLAEHRPRHVIQQEIKSKERAIAKLVRKYESNRLSADAIERCLYSINDNNSYLNANRLPVDKMILYLKKYFHATIEESEEFSLAIQSGYGGARLSHNHQRQYHYVLQSLTLWRNILHDMFRLWYLAESDLLEPTNSYRLSNTGQGLNRVQQAPKIGNAMRSLLHHTQQSVDHWIGSSVVHLGDHNVPNALTFIDKYTQVPRILSPLVLTLEKIPELVKSAGMQEYIDTTFGSVDRLQKTILADFFRHAFDGSGADNFFDAGSCIDGRLTSAWNWCSKIEKKAYFPVFLLTNFCGFDGNFQK